LPKGPLSISLAVSIALGIIACGKKGPPLAPFSDLPAAVTDLTARQVGSDLVFQFTVPTANTDARKPANLDRMELYVNAERQRVPTEYLRQGRLAGSVKVRRPPPPGEEAPPPAPADSGIEQGTTATITAMPDFFVPPVLRRPVTPPADTSLIPVFADGGGPLLSARPPTSETRLFVVAGVNRRGRRGPPSPVLEVPIVTPPAAPTRVEVTYTEQAIALTWTPPSLANRRPIQDPVPRAGALASRPLATFVSPRSYNVYQVTRQTDSATSPTQATVPSPLNPKPLSETRFEDARMEFGVERCFHVRTRETIGTFAVESVGSTPSCVTPVDTFAPAAPTQLIAVGGEGAVNLLWEPNAEADLGGYQVLRGDAAGEKLQPLTKSPISETTYRDGSVQPGMKYVYVIVAVDKAGNVSAQSNRAPN
jgi:hypothetical protein